MGGTIEHSLLVYSSKQTITQSSQNLIHVQIKARKCATDRLW